MHYNKIYNACEAISGYFAVFSPNLPRIHVGLYCKGKWKTKVKTLSIFSDVYCLFSSMYSEEVTLLSIDSVLIYFSTTSVISLVIHEFIRSRDQRVKKLQNEFDKQASMALFLVKVHLTPKLFFRLNESTYCLN